MFSERKRIVIFFVVLMVANTGVMFAAKANQQKKDDRWSRVKHAHKMRVDNLNRIEAELEQRLADVKFWEIVERNTD